jgi:hypothetical protein
VANQSAGSVCEHPLSVRKLLQGSVLSAERQQLGDVLDIAVRLRDGQYPLVIGAEACVGGNEEFLPSATLARWHSDGVQVLDEPDRHPPPERDGTVLMCSELLGQQLSDLQRGRQVRVHDLLLSHSSEGWVLTSVDTRGWVSRTFGKRFLSEGRLDWKMLHSRAGYELEH